MPSRHNCCWRKWVKNTLTHFTKILYTLHATNACKKVALITRLITALLLACKCEIAEKRKKCHPNFSSILVLRVIIGSAIFPSMIVQTPTKTRSKKEKTERKKELHATESPLTVVERQRNDSQMFVITRAYPTERKLDALWLHIK